MGHVAVPLIAHSYTNLNSICLRSLLAVQTRGVRPVFNLCSSNWDEIICVVISVSAAVPAPQQLKHNIFTIIENMHHTHDTAIKCLKFSRLKSKTTVV